MTVHYIDSSAILLPQNLDNRHNEFIRGEHTSADLRSSPMPPTQEATKNTDRDADSPPSFISATTNDISGNSHDKTPPNVLDGRVKSSNTNTMRNRQGTGTFTTSRLQDEEDMRVTSPGRGRFMAKAHRTPAPVASSVIEWLISFLVRSLTLAMSHMLRLIGEWIPLRGFTSLAYDLGVPGASTILELLNQPTNGLGSSPNRQAQRRAFTVSRRDGAPKVSIHPNSIHNDDFDYDDGLDDHLQVPVFNELKNLAEHTSTIGGEENDNYVKQTNDLFDAYHSEIKSVIGSVFHGEEGCTLKFACQIGKRLSSVTGANTLTMTVAMLRDQLPRPISNLWKENSHVFDVLMQSVMYTSDCSKFECGDEDQKGGLSDEANQLDDLGNEL